MTLTTNECHYRSGTFRSRHRKLSDGSQNISHELVAYFARFGYNKGEPNHEGRNRVMSITATELKSNLGKYLLLAATEDIFITRNGKVVAKLQPPSGQSGHCQVPVRDSSG